MRLFCCRIIVKIVFKSYKEKNSLLFHYFPPAIKVIFICQNQYINLQIIYFHISFVNIRGTRLDDVVLLVPEVDLEFITLI